MSKPILYLMMGYPGSGKTSVAIHIKEITRAVHIWADIFRQEKFNPPTHNLEETRQLYRYLDNIVIELLSSGKSVIYDTNFNFYKDRQRLREIAHKNGADCVLFWVKVPKEVAKERSSADSKNQKTRIFELSENHFERKVRNLQEPRIDEHFIEVEGTKITKSYIQDLLKRNGIV